MSGVKHRFPRAVRLRSSRDYQRISGRSHRIRTPHFTVLISDDQKPGTIVAGARLGLTASRKVGNAVARNRVKRRIREWFRRHDVIREMALDVVVIARVGAAVLSSREIGAELSGVARCGREKRRE
jgi:ribonuclease P protein component